MFTGHMMRGEGMENLVKLAKFKETEQEVDKEKNPRWRF
jgi:hypothetical protein